MENHIARIERFGDVHIGTHAVLDNRQPPEGSEYRSESLPALMMDNTKPGIYQHLRFHLDSDDAYVDCFVHEENLGVLLSGDEGDVRFLDALDVPDEPSEGIITWDYEELKDREGEWTSLATHVGLKHDEAANVFVEHDDDGRVTTIAIDPHEVVLYDRYKKDLRQTFGDSNVEVVIEPSFPEIDWSREPRPAEDDEPHYLAGNFLDDTTIYDVDEVVSDRDAAKGFVLSTNLIMGRLKLTPEDDCVPWVRLTKYEHGRQGIRNLFAAMQQEYDKHVAPTTVDISDLDVEIDKQL